MSLFSFFPKKSSQEVCLFSRHCTNLRHRQENLDTLSDCTDMRFGENENLDTLGKINLDGQKFFLGFPILAAFFVTSLASFCLAKRLTIITAVSPTNS